MAPPVRFFERLMPAAPSAGAHVHAALPSRFAPPGLELTAPESLEQDDAADIGAASRDHGDFAPRGHAAPRDAGQSVTAPPPRTDRAITRGDSVVDARAPQGSAAAPADLSDAVDATARVPSTRSLPTRERAAVDDDIVPNRRVRPAAHGASALVRARRAAPVPAASVAPHAPLREQVRERRIGPPPVPPPTIVQVTIDRIDVRAPAANAQPERSVSKPRNDSWKSLGDYLRQRERGGAS